MYQTRGGVISLNFSTGEENKRTSLPQFSLVLLTDISMWRQGEGIEINCTLCTA